MKFFSTMAKFRVARWNTGNFRVGGLYAPWGAYHATIPVGQRPSDDQPTGKDDRTHIRLIRLMRLIRPITPLKELDAGIPPHLDTLPLDSFSSFSELP